MPGTILDIRDIAVNMVIKVFCACVLSYVQLFASSGTIAHQASLSMGLSRQE